MRFGLIAILFLAGCTEELCLDGDITESTSYEGRQIDRPMLTGAGGVSFVSWESDETVQTADLEGNEMRLQQTPFSPRLARWSQASAPTGHLIVSTSLEVELLSFGRGGPATVIPFPFPRSGSPPVVTFDGTRFLIAWTAPGGLMLASLVPGAGAISNPVVVANVSTEHVAMASSGGVTWFAWTQGTSVMGIRIVNGAPAGAAPVMIHHDARINQSGHNIRIEGSNGRFLIAVEASKEGQSRTLFVPIDSNAMPGNAIEIPGPLTQLARTVDGFATLEDPYYTNVFGDTRSFWITRRALDGTAVSELEVSGVQASLGFDGNRLVLALRQDFPDGDEGETVLSVRPLDETSGVEVVRHRGPLRTVQHCLDPE